MTYGTSSRNIDPRFSRSRQWKPIERLPDTPGVVKMTSTGYVIDGQHVRTVPKASAAAVKRGWLARVLG